MVDLQCDVGVLGGVRRRPRDIDLLEGNALYAGAGHLVVGEGLHAEMAGGKAVHVVTRVALQHVGLEQGVVGDAPQCDAVIGKHVLVVLDVLSELFVPRALEPGLEDRERRLDPQLLRRPRVVVRKRKIGRTARDHGKRHAHELRLHRIEARRLGVEGHELGRFEVLQPAPESRFSSRGASFNSSISNGSFTSHFTASKPRAFGSQSSALRRFSPTAPPISGACRTTSSSEPYSASHFAAVFGPTLSTPGTLSTESPTSVR